VYAKGDLLSFCREQGIAATPFSTFDDVARGESFDEVRS
jgi:2-hydroxy-3-keto-5-methylthiopentenyl-1-phosphate phosphatase